MSADEPEDREPALPASTWARVRAGMASDDGAPMPPGVLAAFQRGSRLVFGQPRKLVAVSVLILVLLLPALRIVSSGQGSYLAVFVVTALMSVTYVRREGATARVSLTWLAVVAALCMLLGLPWIGFLLIVLFVPFTAVSVAAWASGSWRIGARAVGRMFRATWVSTIALSLAVEWMVAIGLALVFVAGGGGVPVGVGYLALVASLMLGTALAIGYALVALERGAAMAAVTESAVVPTGS